MTPTATSIDDLGSLVGSHLGYSGWRTVDQARVDLFADATDDHQWLHVDPERARGGPFGGPIAHGYLSLALVPSLLEEVLDVAPTSMLVNYGCNRVRFPAPLPVGHEVRLGATLAEVQEVDGGAQAAIDVALEVRDAPKPVCVAQVVYRYYR